MNHHPTVSVLITTKNRPSDVLEALASLAVQSVEPLEVVIVDQSESDDTATAVREASKRWPRMVLIYVHDCSISGASAGRNRAMDDAKGAIWFFMDDDVALEPNFFKELLNVYRRFPHATGVCGTITNYKPPHLTKRIWEVIFVRGPFHDERQPLYWRSEVLRNAAPTPVRKFGAGMASFRAEVIRDVRFDLHPSAFGAEDVDFCLRIPQRGSLLLTCQARCVHKRTETARSSEYWLRASARATSFLYRKHWKVGAKNRICFWWLQIGYACAALVGSVKGLSMTPWRALVDGIKLAPAPR